MRVGGGDHKVNKICELHQCACMYVCVCMRVGAHMRARVCVHTHKHAMVCVWRTDDNLQEWALVSYHGNLGMELSPFV